MPTTTIEQVALSLKIDDVEFNCQVIDASLTLPGDSTGATVEVACPDGVVVEPGDHQDGTLTGTVFTDTTDAGITWALIQAQQAGATLAYAITWFADQDATKAFTITGTAQVGTFSIDWAKPGFSRHPLDLVLLDAAIGRPA